MWRSISIIRCISVSLWLVLAGFCSVVEASSSVRASVSRSTGATAYKYYSPGGVAPAGVNDYYGNTPQGSATKTFSGWGIGSAANDAVPVGTNVPVPLVEAAGILVSLVGAVGRTALAHPAVQVGVACLAACPALYDWLTDAGITVNPDGSLTSGGLPTAQLYYETYVWAPGRYPSISAAIAAVTAAYTAANPGCTVSQVTGDGSTYANGIQVVRAQYGGGCSGWNGVYQHSQQGCPTGYTLEGGQCYPAGGAAGPVTQAEAVPVVQAAPRTATELTQIARELDERKALPNPDSVTVTGPAEVDGGVKVQTNPDGSRVETQTKHKLEYQGDTLKLKTEVTTKTYNPENQLQSTQTTTAPAEPAPVEMPDDYAREATLEAIREALASRQATAGDRACTQPPACSGDAILCAIVTQVWRQSCQWQESQPDGEPGEPDEVDVDDLVGSLSRTRWSAPATCPADITFQSMAGQITIPMQYACDQAAILRPFVIGAALLAAAFIVIGARS